MILTSDLSNSATIECDYGYTKQYVLGSTLQCDVYNDPDIKYKSSRSISTFKEYSMPKNMYRSDVKGFYVGKKTMHYFPEGLKNYFGNLELIYIYKCELKEIQKSDLMPFTKLVYFYSHYNSLTMIEEGLFDHNPNLQLVGFYEEKIIHIDPDVFDHLSSLNYFWFYYVPCIAQDIYDSRSEVLDAIKIIKAKCVSAEVLKTKIEKLERSKSDQSSTVSNLNDLKNLINNHEAKINQLLSSTSQCKSSQDHLNTSISNIANSVNYFATKLSNETNTKMTQLELFVQKSQSTQKTTTDALEDLKETQQGIISLQNDVTRTLDDIKSKLETYEEIVDKKIKAIEKNLMGKIEELLEEKMDDYTTKKEKSTDSNIADIYDDF